MTDFKLTEDIYESVEALKAYLDDLVSDPMIISEERFHEALNVLPPARWENHGGIEMFFVIERYTHNLVNWYFKIADIEPLYFVCLDYDNKKGEDLAEKAIAAYNTLKGKKRGLKNEL